MFDVIPELQAIPHQQQLLAEARQERLLAQLRAPRDGQLSAQWSNLGAPTRKAPAGGSAFDAGVRQLAQRLTRRRLWGVATAVALGAAIGRRPASADARNRNRKRNKTKKLQRNSFACVDVGKACRGNSDNCCSGICEGKKPKKGKKDTSRCVGHNTGGCPDGQFGGACGATAICLQTTGNAGFCALGFGCVDCQKDADCDADLFGPNPACVVANGLCGGARTACARAGA